MKTTHTAGGQASERAEKAEAELALAANTLSYVSETLDAMGIPSVLKERSLSCEQRMDRALEKKTALSTLRPIAEAGPVSAGCVRYYFRVRSDKSVSAGTQTKMHADTHFADIRLPESPKEANARAHAEFQAELEATWNGETESQAPAVEAKKKEHPVGLNSALDQCPDEPAEPATFEAHGKEWTRHVPGDPMPCDGERMVEVVLSDGSEGDTPRKARYWSWLFCKELTYDNIIGWRYADEPTPEPAQPWPAVSDVVTLKSGGPKMTVVDNNGAKVTCLWFNPSLERTFGDFLVATLTPA